MLLEQLSMLDEFLTDDEKQKVFKYFNSITPNISDLITVSKIVEFTGIKQDKVLKVLDVMVYNKLIHYKFGVRCPDCGLLIDVYDSIEKIEEISPIYCYGCEIDINFSRDNIVLIFSIDSEKNFFEYGQQVNAVNIKNSMLVAQNDTLSSIGEYKVSYLSDLGEIIEYAKRENLKSKKMNRLNIRLKIFYISLIILFLVLFCEGLYQKWDLGIMLTIATFLITLVPQVVMA